MLLRAVGSRQNMNEYSILNLPVHLSENYTQWLIDRLKQQQGSQVVTLNAEMAMLGEKNPDLAQVIKQADLVIPDGAGVVLYLRLRGQKQHRCPGIELAESLLKELGKESSVCFYGGKPGVAEQAAQHWQEKIPGMSIIFNHGYLELEEEKQWLQTIQDQQPSLVFVGLGVPRQEFWIRDHRHLSTEAIWIGIGGSFDIWSGNKTRAPKLFRENNLEWLYRLYQEPWRWRRMLALPKFFWRVILS